MQLSAPGFMDFGIKIGIYLAKNIAYNTQKRFETIKLK